MPAPGRAMTGALEPLQVIQAGEGATAEPPGPQKRRAKAPATAQALTFDSDAATCDLGGAGRLLTHTSAPEEKSAPGV